MTQQQDQSDRFSPVPMVAAMLAAPAAAAGLALALAGALNWTTGEHSWSAFQTAGAAAACWMVGGLLGVVVMAATTSLRSRRLAAGMIASSLTRAGIALVDALALTLLVRPEMKIFWSAFLAAGLLCLVIETLWSMSALKRVSGPLAAPAPAT